MRFSSNLSENRFCYLKKASHYYYSHLLLHTPKKWFRLYRRGCSQIFVCRSFDHRSCGFLSIPIRKPTSLEPWKLPDPVASICAIGHPWPPRNKTFYRCLNLFSLPSHFHPVFSRFSPLLYIPKHKLYIYQITLGSSERWTIGRRTSKNWYREIYAFFLREDSSRLGASLIRISFERTDQEEMIVISVKIQTCVFNDLTRLLSHSPCNIDHFM